MICGISCQMQKIVRSIFTLFDSNFSLCKSSLVKHLYDRRGKVKFNSSGQIITSLIFILLVFFGIFSLWKLTGYDIASFFQKVNFSIGVIVLVIGLFLFGIYFYLKGGKKNGRR